MIYCKTMIYCKLNIYIAVIFTFLISHTTIHAFENNYLSKDIETVLIKAGKNRAQLEKAIVYFKKNKSDSLKLKALYFLIQNMDIHYSANYYWVDDKNNKVKFNELDYPNFETSVKAFEKITTNLKLKPKTIYYNDIDSIKGQMLIDNIELAFKVWQKPWAKSIPFEQFCEYILPYRVSVEPLENWRSTYLKQFEWVEDSVEKTNMTAASLINNNLRTWFLNTVSFEDKAEPLPRMSPSQLLFRKQGVCPDMVGLVCFALRSQGVPCVSIAVTQWATSSGRHFWVQTLNNFGEVVPFDAMQQTIQNFAIPREPAKVLRITYAKQPDVLASLIDKNDIPDGLLRLKNYIDVTSNYWPVANVTCKLFDNLQHQKIIYATVYNTANWRPAWWGKAINNTVEFNNMAKGAVYLPMTYKNKRYKPIGYPIAIGYRHSMVLKPDTVCKHQITLNEQPSYLMYRIGKKYELRFWNNAWVKHSVKIADETNQLVFDNVPQNALLILIPEYSKGKERPFIITNEGERIWW